jgi:hypothetical protein
LTKMVGMALLSPLFHKWRNWGTQRSNKLLKGIHLVK